MSDTGRPYRYGDFPELFWDLKKDVEIDRENPVIMARVIREGGLKHVRALVPIPALIRHFDELVLPDHVRAFWALVIQKLQQNPPDGRDG